MPGFGASISTVIPFPHTESDLLPALSSTKTAPKYFELLLRFIEVKEAWVISDAGLQFSISTDPESEPRPI